jgi:hypothetical protein
MCAPSGCAQGLQVQIVQSYSIAHGVVGQIRTDLPKSAGLENLNGNVRRDNIDGWFNSLMITNMIKVNGWMRDEQESISYLRMNWFKGCEGLESELKRTSSL